MIANFLFRCQVAHSSLIRDDERILHESQATAAGHLEVALLTKVQAGEVIRGLASL